MNKIRKIELLAPARNADIGIEAIRHGADAVYIGAERFGARVAAGNSVEDIARLAEYAHTFNAKVYVTINTIFRDDELKEVESLIISKAFLGASAVDAYFGVSNNLSYEIDLKRAVAEQAEKVILMVTCDKIGKTAAMKICAADRLYAIVTDRQPDPELLEVFAEKGIKVIY